MHTEFWQTEEAPNKWWAWQDAHMRNAVNSTLYDQKQKIAAERRKLALELVYAAKNVYIAYGKKGISIKVDRPLVRDKKELRLLENLWTTQGVIKRTTPQGITYRWTVA
jgi:hypothetical protein